MTRKEGKANKPIPVLFIHGFQGFPHSWATLRGALIARGADPDLLRVFHYGWRAYDGRGTEPVYNNEADIREIAARLVRRESGDPDLLQSQVTRLSEASVVRGGPARVTLVAHSMGGLVARYYLSRSTVDEWGTVNEGVVGRLITIATPHLGVELATLTRLVPQDAYIWKVLRWLERLPVVAGRPSVELARLEKEVEALQTRAHIEAISLTAYGYSDSPALRQMVPESDFLRELNRAGAFPEDVESALIWGDVRIAGVVQWGPARLWAREVSLGDLLVSAQSASGFRLADSQRFAVKWDRRYVVEVGSREAAPYNLSHYLPPVSHSNLLGHTEVQAAVARLVGL